MAAFTPTGVVVSFSGTQFAATAVQVTYPTAEVCDCTTTLDPIGTKVLIPTGDVKEPGTITVACNKHSGLGSYASMLGVSGTLSFSSPDWNSSWPVVCTNVTENAELGGIAKCSISFQVK